MVVAGPHALLPPVPGVTHQWTDDRDVRLHYASAGQGRGGPPIVLLHGFPELWYAWRHQLVALGRSHRVAAPDLRGYGLSSRPAGREAYRVALLVEDIRRIADHLGAPRIVLVGHDWGGVLAWAFAARHPRRVARLVIVNAPHPATLARELRRSPRQMLASAYVLLFRAPFGLAERVLRAGDYALLEQLLQRGRRGGYFTPEDAAVYRAAWRVPGALTAGLEYYRALGRDDAAGATGRVTCPTTVIWGERDRYLRPGLLEGLDAHVDTLEVVRVPDASHWIVHERPELLTKLIGGS
ncbi:MAG: Soluble epoxide hydrolase [Gemmatimonadetes bacterium]|jgi:pimeloyl-ACP methyl ester carboxylesterase|nr:Soluble epoxide hydrolase [Gemmatimonadota bacterium]